MAFEILHHLDKLTPDGGTNAPHGDHSFHCPACDSPNFKVNVRTGKWGTYGCDCASTEDGKRKIRNAISPAKRTNDSNPIPTDKPKRPTQHRGWEYFDKAGNFLFTVHRWDDHESTAHRFKNGRCIRQTFSRWTEADYNKQIWKNSEGQSPADLKHLAMPYGWKEAKQALADGAAFVPWVEGEPCVDSLRALGLFAVTSLGGCNGFIPDRDGPKSTGIPSDRLCVIPDRDKSGIKYADLVAAAYENSSRFYPFGDTPEWNGSMPNDGGLDIADWIQLGGTAVKLVEGIKSPLQVESDDPLDIWDEACRALVDPTSKTFERNTIRRLIRAGMLASDLGIRAADQSIRKRLVALQRDMLRSGRTKGTRGGERVTYEPTQYLIPGLVQLGCLTGIAAFAKVGKTRLATELTASLIHQTPFMGNPEWKPAAGKHKLLLWWVDQPGSNSRTYLQNAGLIYPDGTLHEQILALYTEEDDLCWDDEGVDILLRHQQENPDLILITDSFFHSIQRIHGTDQEPSAGGALIDIQTMLLPSGNTHICLFHSPHETGDRSGVRAIRGHSSVAGAVSSCISLHFTEKKNPQTAKWEADKESPYRRMVYEGRGQYLDLLVKLTENSWTVHGDFSKGIARLAQGEQADELPSLTKNQRDVLDVISDKPDLTVKQIAYEWKQREPNSNDTETTRRTVKALISKRLISEKPSKGGNTYAIRKSSPTREIASSPVDCVGSQSVTAISPLEMTVGGPLEPLVDVNEISVDTPPSSTYKRSNPSPALDTNGVTLKSTVSTNGQIPVSHYLPTVSTVLKNTHTCEEESNLPDWAQDF